MTDIEVVVRVFAKCFINFVIIPGIIFIILGIYFFFKLKNEDKH